MYCVLGVVYTEGLKRVVSDLETSAYDTCRLGFISPAILFVEVHSLASG